MPLLQTTTAEGALKGMVLARAPHELQDQEVAYLQDCIVSQPGFVNRRGAIQGGTAITAANIDNVHPIHLCTVFDPAGVQKIGVIYYKDETTFHSMWMAIFDTSFAFIQKHQMLANVTPGVLYPQKPAFVVSTPAVDGSLLISVRTRYDRSANALGYVMKWYGGSPPASTKSASVGVTAGLNSTVGSTAVTGLAAEIAKLSVGTVLVDNGGTGIGLGVVNTITSTTQIELAKPALISVAAGTPIQYQVFEGLGIIRSRGKISHPGSGVGVPVTGYGTRFQEVMDDATTAVLNSVLLDPADNFRVATHGSGALASSDTVMPTWTLNRAMALREYLLVFTALGGAMPFRYTNEAAGSSHTPYQAYGNLLTAFKDYNVSYNGLVNNFVAFKSGETKVTGRAWIHGPRLPEIMDHTVSDGDWFDTVSAANRGGDNDGIAIMGGRNACVLSKMTETWAMEGDTTDDFNLVKIADDGALSAESMTTYQGDVIWMGKLGIWRFDGQSAPVNIIKDTLGDRWVQLLTAFDTKSAALDSNNYLLNQARCFAYRDHLFVNITNTGSAHSVYTDGVSRTQNSMQLVIYLPTGAVSYITNFNFNSFCLIGRQGYVLLPQQGSTTHYFFPVDNLFTQGVATSDAILTPNVYNSGTPSTSVGPWFHMESRKYDGGDGLWKKSWKQLAIEFNETSTKRIWLETVAGLNTTGVRALLPYTGTGAFLAARVKFRTRDQYMSFRLYEDISNRPTSLVLGAWQWGYKFARRGAV